MTAPALFLLGISAAAGCLLVYGLLRASEAHESAESGWGRAAAWIVTVALAIVAGAFWYLSVGQLQVIEDMHRILGIG